MANPILQLKGVTKTYCSESGNNVSVLNNFNLTVKSGEFIAVIGPTGCGKTTLLNIIAGLEKADSGEVIVSDGLPPGHHIPCVFQHYTLFPWRSLLANVCFGLEMQKISRTKRDAIARDLLIKVGLEGFEKAYPHELSGGMRQRAAIAQALSIQPKILLMDEPFGAVDDKTRSHLQQMLEKIWKEQDITILFVTHNLDEAIFLGDRIINISDLPGKIINDLPVELPRPRDPSSREFADLFMRIR